MEINNKLGSISHDQINKNTTNAVEFLFAGTGEKWAYKRPSILEAHFLQCSKIHRPSDSHKGKHLCHLGLYFPQVNKFKKLSLELVC